MAAVLQRSAELASVVMQREVLRRGIDVYIQVPVKQFGMLDFHAAPEIIRAGYDIAGMKIAEWRGTFTVPARQARRMSDDRDSG